MLQVWAITWGQSDTITSRNPHFPIDKSNSDDWGDYERILAPAIIHYAGKDRTQRLEHTNEIVRQQTGRWHRRQNKFGSKRRLLLG